MNIYSQYLGINNANINVNTTTRINPYSSNLVDKFSKNEGITSPYAHPNRYPIGTELLSPSLRLSAYLEKSNAEKLLNAAPKIKEKLAKYGFEAEIRPENVKKIEKSHLQTTTAWALQIANEMKLSQYEKKILEEACVFHDFGKSVIPDEILNKPGILTKEEKEVMDLHAEFGYELLQNTKINKRVLEIIRDHHKPHTNESDILQEILSVADIYSALREERPYKKALSNKDAMSILDQKAKRGEVSTEVVNALKYSMIKTHAAA